MSERGDGNRLLGAARIEIAPYYKRKGRPQVQRYRCCFTYLFPRTFVAERSFIYETERANGSLHRERRRRGNCVLHPSSGVSRLRPIGSKFRNSRAGESADRAESTQGTRRGIATD